MSTRLGRFFDLGDATQPGLSGFTLLTRAREAFIARLALADLAERSLDMQYYVWDGDITGRIIVDRVMRAAQRGVKVRLLVDDPYYRASDPVKAALDAHPNVEVRLFNPATSRRWSRLNFLVDFRRLNRRMHNKLTVADNAAAIVGGRNIGDAYYGVDTRANFRDLDVLAVGPIVGDLSSVFDRYWTSAATVPIRKLVKRAYGAEDLEALLARLRRDIVASDYPYPVEQDLRDLAAQGAALRKDLVWARGRVIADDPDAVTRGSDADEVVTFIRHRVAGLTQELLADAPYFVLPARAQAIIRGLVERGVRVRVLTNSLASNNQIAAHAGYAKTRRRLLDYGLDLYELRPDTDTFHSDWSHLSQTSRASLHTKAMVFDRSAVFIGSFNLDPRSALINAEAGLYIESRELAERLATYMATGVEPANSYHLRCDRTGSLVWETLKDGKPVQFQSEPETSVWRRLAAALVKLLPIDSQV